MTDQYSSISESLSDRLKGQLKSEPNRVDKIDVSSLDGLESSGFKYRDQPIPDILAYCFGNDKGEKKLEEINTKAISIDDTGKRKTFIEEQLRDYAKDSFDDKISTGLKENFFGASEKYQQAIRDGRIKDGDRLTLENAGSIDNDKDPMFGMLKGLGLNIHGDNCRADYQETVNARGEKVKVLSLSIVNRPTTNIIDRNSQHQKLASVYADTLSPNEKKQFQDSFARHTDNARNGEPKMSVDDFNKSCEANLDKQIAEIKNSKSQSTAIGMDNAKQQASKIAKEMMGKGADTSSTETHYRPSMQRTGSNSSLGR